MKRIYLLSFLLIISSFSFAQRAREASPLTIAGGTVYSLPRTGIRIHVKATQEKFYFGPYHEYSDVMLGLKNAPSSDRENWVINDIRIETFSEPDPQHVYKAKGLGGVLIGLTESGTLAGINSQIESSPTKLQVSKFLGNTYLPEIPFPDKSMNPFSFKPDSGARVNFIVKSTEVKAREAADAIMSLRERRFNTLANEYEDPLPDGRAYEVMVEELAKLEKEYLSLFVGKKIQEQFEYSFDYVPGASSVAGDVVFRFNEAKGVLPASDMSGRPITLEMKKLDNLAAAQAKVSDEPNSSGVFYRLPGIADIRLLNGINLMATARIDVAQFGTVVPLPEEMLNGNFSILFHQSTGAIKSVIQK